MKKFMNRATNKAAGAVELIEPGNPGAELVAGLMLPRTKLYQLS